MFLLSQMLQMGTKLQQTAPLEAHLAFRPGAGGAGVPSSAVLTCAYEVCVDET